MGSIRDLAAQAGDEVLDTEGADVLALAISNGEGSRLDQIGRAHV